MGKIRLAGLAAAVLLATVTSSFAVPVVSYTGLDVPGLNALMPMTSLSPTSTSGGYYDNYTGNQFSGPTLVARTPWEGSIHEKTGPFSSVQGGGSATFEFNIVQTGLSLLWGSPDTYNDLIITLFGGGGTYTINGADVQGPVGVLASLLNVTNVSFDKVVLTSGSNAFEFANFKTTPVPLPAGVLLLVTAVGGLAFAARRKKAA